MDILVGKQWYSSLFLWYNVHEAYLNIFKNIAFETKDGLCQVLLRMCRNRRPHSLSCEAIMSNGAVAWEVWHFLLSGKPAGVPLAFPPTSEASWSPSANGMILYYVNPFLLKYLRCFSSMHWYVTEVTYKTKNMGDSIPSSCRPLHLVLGAM